MRSWSGYDRARGSSVVSLQRCSILDWDSRLDGDRFTAYLNEAFASRLPQTLSFHPWLYPPPFLLLLVPFGFLSFEAACALFLLTTFLLLVLVLWRTTGPGFRPWLHSLSLLTIACALVSLRYRTMQERNYAARRLALNTVPQLALGPTRSYAGSKRALNNMLYPNLEEQLDLEAEIQHELARSDDFLEGVGAFVEKREAAFSGR